MIDTPEYINMPNTPTPVPEVVTRRNILVSVFVSKEVIELLINDKERSTWFKQCANVIGFLAQSGLLIICMIANCVTAICMKDKNNFKQTIMIFTIINIIVAFIQSLLSKMGVAASVEKEMKERKAKETAHKEAEEAKEKIRKEAEEARDLREEMRYRKLLQAIVRNNMIVPPNIGSFLSSIDSSFDNHLKKYRMDLNYDLVDLLTPEEKKQYDHIV